MKFYYNLGQKSQNDYDFYHELKKHKTSSNQSV